MEYQLILNEREMQLVTDALHAARSELLIVSAKSNDMPLCKELAIRAYKEYWDLVEKVRTLTKEEEGE